MHVSKQVVQACNTVTLSTKCKPSPTNPHWPPATAAGAPAAAPTASLSRDTSTSDRARISSMPCGAIQGVGMAKYEWGGMKQTVAAAQRSTAHNMQRAACATPAACQPVP